MKKILNFNTNQTLTEAAAHDWRERITTLTNLLKTTSNPDRMSEIQKIFKNFLIHIMPKLGESLMFLPYKKWAKLYDKNCYKWDLQKN